MNRTKSTSRGNIPFGVLEINRDELLWVFKLWGDSPADLLRRTTRLVELTYPDFVPFAHVSPEMFNEIMQCSGLWALPKLRVNYKLSVRTVFFVLGIRK